MPGDPGADLSKLEYEFATDPNSEAFIPLARAYLSMGRFVEAMVVCKKGIKAHPDLPTGRLIMAKIYADQAKHQKAIEELNSLLKLSPENAEAFRLMGNIHLKLGKQDDAVGFLKKALDSDPNDREAKDALLKIGIDYVPVSAQPPPVIQAVSAPPPVATPQPRFTPAGGIPRTRGQEPAPLVTPTKTPARGVPVSERPTERALPVQQQPVRPMPTPQRKRIADLYHEMEAGKKKPAHRGLKYTMYMGGVLLLGLIIYVIYAWQAGRKQAEINKNLTEGRTQFNQDSYRGYTKALENYRNIYKLDNSNAEALARGAFIDAVLVGEFGGSRDLLTEGTKYLTEAQAKEQNSTNLTAARGMMMLYGGGAKNDAVKVVEDAIKKNPDSSVLHATLGYIYLNQGKLTEARDELIKAASANEIRAFVALGDYAIRRSMYREATQFFAKALQSDPGHTRALLNSGLVALLRGNTIPDTKGADATLKKFKDDLEKDASEKEKTLAKLIATVIKLRGNDKRAGLAELKDLTKKESGNEIFQFVAAREFRRQGSLPEAKEAIERALRLDSSRPDFLLEEASVYLTMGDFENARSRALRVQAMDAESGLSLLLAGDAYRAEAKSDKVPNPSEKEKDFQKAIDYYKKALKFEDVESISHLRLGQALLEIQNPDENMAQEELGLAVSGLIQLGERREAAEACFWLARILAKKNLRDRFKIILEQGMNIDPTYAPLYYLIAIQLDITTADGKTAAKENCEKYLGYDPNGEYANTCKEILRRVAGGH